MAIQSKKAFDFTIYELLRIVARDWLNWAQSKIGVIRGDSTSDIPQATYSVFRRFFFVLCTYVDTSVRIKWIELNILDKLASTLENRASPRAEKYMCVFRCSCPCKWMFLFIRAAAFSRDPLCPNIPLRQLSFDLSDLAMLFSVCFRAKLWHQQKWICWYEEGLLII